MLERKYSSIDLLFGDMLLTCQNYKYGVVDYNGKTILENKFDDIYMPQPNIMRIKYNGIWYEIEQVSKETLTLPKNVKDVMKDKNFIISELIQNPTTMTGYSLVSFTDYLLKLFFINIPISRKKQLMNLCYLKVQIQCQYLLNFCGCQNIRLSMQKLL
ncbi:MAG: WG repeat-containing protein [Candidatus Melainabacteria bacterium]|nr:MAG: WG repeat-containing protein [Candidatus Melainabacteria bacterium]